MSGFSRSIEQQDNQLKLRCTMDGKADAQQPVVGKMITKSKVQSSEQRGLGLQPL